MAGRNIITTGASGFIGKQVVRADVEQGNRVAMLDMAEPEGLEKIIGSANMDRVRFFKCDIRDEASVFEAGLRADAWLDSGIDAVKHLAAMFNYSKSYGEMYNVNVMGTMNIAEIAVMLKVPKLLNMGAIASHEEGAKGLIKESDPYAPIENYGKTKHEAEELLFQDYHRPGRLKVATFRSVMVYGPDALGSYIDGQFNMIHKSKGPVAMPLKDGINSYVHTYDIGRAFAHAVEHEESFAADAKELGDIAYNLADDHPISDHNITRLIIDFIEDDTRLPDDWPPEMHFAMPFPEDYAEEVLKNKNLYERIKAAYEFGKEAVEFVKGKRKRFVLPAVPHSILGIAAAVSEPIEKRLKPRASLPKGVVMHAKHSHLLDNRKFKQMTGFEYAYPTTIIGLREVVQWYKDEVWK